MNKRICIVFTGTVASTLCLKIVRKFRDEGYSVDVVVTERGKHFIPVEMQIGMQFRDEKVYTDRDEWGMTSYSKGDLVRHVEIAKSCNALLIIASADFMAKMVNGFCDDLASSLYRAWRPWCPVVVAPAMNTHMWNHPVTAEHINKLKEWGVSIVPPVSKKLACGDEGMGALAEIYDIYCGVNDMLRNEFPIWRCNGIPVGTHPGAFGTDRKHGKHTGVDLYTFDYEPVRAMNDGVVMSVEDFTGKGDGSTWWEDTRCVLVQHWFGVVCYGEINAGVRVGQILKRRQRIGMVKRVLKPGKERPDIPGHSLSMLHVELYADGTKKASNTWAKDHEMLIDPTPMILDAAGGMYKKLEYKEKSDE